MNNIQRSKTKTLISVLLFSLLITFLTNLLFKFDTFSNVFENKLYAVLVGLIIYGIWIFIIYLLLKKDQFRLEDFGISKRSCLEGLLAGFYLLFIVNLILSLLSFFKTGHVVISDGFSSLDLIFVNLGVFTFNIFIGAFIEELIFRGYLIPQFFHIFKTKIASNVIALVIAIILSQIAFALFHLPVRIYRNEIPTSSLIPGISELFISGVAFSLIYLRTRNLMFVAFVHSLLNLPLVFIETENSFSLLIVIVVLIMVLFKQRLVKSASNITFKNKGLLI